MSDFKCVCCGHAVHNGTCACTEADLRIFARKTHERAEGLRIEAEHLRGELEATKSDKTELVHQHNQMMKAFQAESEAAERLRGDRDALIAARIAYAREFPPDKNGELDIGSIHENIRRIKAELAELRAQTDKARSLTLNAIGKICTDALCGDFDLLNGYSSDHHPNCSAIRNILDALPPTNTEEKG